MFQIIRTNYLSTLRHICKYKNVKYYQTISYCLVEQPILCKCVINNYNLQNYRYKTKKERVQSKIQDDEQESDIEEDAWEKTLTDKNTKIVSVKVNSSRADLILKAGLGIARNKIEVMFYESRIRVNGRKIFKKSEQLHVGDEVDIIKGTSVSNPKFLTIGRVEILSINAVEEGINVRLRRCKTLIVENYPDPWKPSTADV